MTAPFSSSRLEQLDPAEIKKMADEITRVVDGGHHKAYGTDPHSTTMTAGNAWWRTAADAMRAYVTLSEREEQSPDIHALLGNVIDHWELVPNDIKSDPGMDNLNAAIYAARQGTEGEVRSVSPVGLKPNAPAAAAPLRDDKTGERTNAALLDAKLKHSLPNASFVHADFARQLEHELAAMTKLNRLHVQQLNERPVTPSHAASVGPYKVGEPEDEDGSSTVLNSYGVSMTADEIVALLNTYSKLAVADLSQLIPSAKGEVK